MSTITKKTNTYVNYNALEISLRGLKSDCVDKSDFLKNNEQNGAQIGEIKKRLAKLEGECIKRRSEVESEKKLKELTETTNEEKKSSNTSTREIWEQNRQYFLDHEKEFEEKYPGLFVAVHNGQVLGTHERLGELASDLYDKFGTIPLYADLPGEKEEIQLDLPIVC